MDLSPLTNTVHKTKFIDIKTTFIVVFITLNKNNIIYSTVSTTKLQKRFLVLCYYDMTVYIIRTIFLDVMISGTTTKLTSIIGGEYSTQYDTYDYKTA